MHATTMRSEHGLLAAAQNAPVGDLDGSVPLVAVGVGEIFDGVRVGEYVADRVREGEYVLDWVRVPDRVRVMVRVMVLDGEGDGGGRDGDGVGVGVLRCRVCV